MSSGRRIAGLVGAGLLLALSVYHFGYSAYASQRYGIVDFSIFLQRTAIFVDSGELYVAPDHPGAYAPAAPVYKFPPTFAMLLLPFVRLAPQTVYFSHWLLQIAFYLGCSALGLALLETSNRRLFALAGAMVALNFEPFFETLWRLQLETVILLLLTICLLCTVRRRERCAGVMLGIAAMLKIYPAFLLVYFLARRRWIVVLWTLATATLIQLAGLIVIGPEQNRLFYFEVLPLLLREVPQLSSENIGLARYALALFDFEPTTAKRLAQAVMLMLLAVSVYAVELNRRRAHGAPAAVELSLFLPLMLLAPPNSWVNYQLLLLLPIFVLLAQGVGPRPCWPVLLSTLVAALLMLFYRPCAEPTVGWPCARTPYFLGLQPLPRVLHDLGVDLRGLASLLVWGAACYLLLLPRRADKDASLTAG
jgi:hypothetical protein